jgi:competence protein ComEC
MMTALRTMAEWFAKRPLALLSLCVVTGILVAEHLPLWSFWPLLIVGAALSFRAWIGGRSKDLLLLTAVTFAVRHQAALQETNAHPLFLALEKADVPCDCVVTGRVDKALRRYLPGSQPGASLFYATEIVVPRLQRRFSGHTALKLQTEKNTSLPPGEYRIEGRLHLAFAPDNPGQFDQRDYDKRLGLASEMRARKITLLRADHTNFTAFLQNTAERCRDWVKAQLTLEMDGAVTESALIQAMVLGLSDASTDEMEKPFRQTGTFHIFSVSGLHVGIVGFIFLLFLRPFGARRSVMLTMLLPALFSYVFITGWQPASVRAAVMASVFLSATLFHRRSDTLNSLGVAALLILAFDTRQLFSAGFQLSFGIIASIILINPLFRQPFMRFVEADPFIPKPLLTDWQHRWIAGKSWGLGLLTVTAAATCGSLPLMMAHFRIVTPSSLIANMLLVPMAFLVLFTAIVSLFSAAVHLSGFQALFSNANWLFAKATFLVAQTFSYAPAAYHYLPAPSLALRAPIELNVLRMPESGAAQHLRVGDEHWLFDDGSARDFRFILRSYLQHRGVNSISGLVLSHSDYQHVGGSSLLRNEYPIGTIHQSVLEPWRSEPARSSMRLLAREGVNPQLLSVGDTLSFSTTSMPATAIVLYPAREALPKHADDRALVMRFDLGPYRILWCNDAGFVTEKTLLETHPGEALRCDIIVRNQHATDFSMLPEFVDAVHPRLIISSNSSFPPEQRISAQLRADCTSRHITLLDQAQTGAVTLKIWPSRMDVCLFKQPGKSLIITPSSRHSSPAGN